MIPFDQAYDEFVKRKGDLFEYKEMPMEEEEKKEVEKLDRFSRRITYPVFLIVGLTAFGGATYLLISRDWVIGSGILLCSIALVAFSFYYKSYYGNLLLNGKKVVITGIVTKIVKSGSGYYGFTISEKKKIFFEKKLVKGLKAGDIVRCETLSEQEEIKKKIEKVGNIRDWTG